LIAIVYYLHDVPKYKRIQAKADFCNHCIVNMIQNQNRRITCRDLGRIVCAAALSLYPGNTQYAVNGRFKYGHCIIAYLFYVKGLANNKASVIWMWDSGGLGSSPYVGGTKVSVGGQWSEDRSPVRLRKNVNATEIYEHLKIKEGEVKMIMLLDFRAQNFLDGSSAQSDPKRMFGFLLMPFRSVSGFVQQSYLVQVLVFAPKPGLFSETQPSAG
jgi:hypothetical protein